MTKVISQPEAQTQVKPRLGFVGVGWIGRNRMEAIASSGFAEIAAIADVSPETAREAAKSIPTARINSSISELLDSDLDGVVIATPSALHAEQAIAALERGNAVFCQKPLARTATETKRIIDAARANNCLLAVDLSYRFTEALQKIRDLIISDELGPIHAINLVFHNAYGPDKSWFYDQQLSGGGCVIDLGIHLVDMMLWMLDWPRVKGISSRLFSNGIFKVQETDKVEDYAIALIDLEGGTTATLACSWRLPAGCDAMIEATFYGTKGGARFKNIKGSFYDFMAERLNGTARETLCRPPDNWSGRAAVDWARRLSAGGTFDPEVEHLVEVAMALDGIYGRS
jgi:predicted dehydrogenase